jgi:hypothetical protein
MHFLHSLTDGLWILGGILEIVLSFQIVRKRLQSDFPFFLLFISSDACFTIVLFVLAKLPGNHVTLWWDLYVPRLAITTFLRFCVIYEVFEYIFRSHPTLNRMGKTAFRASLVGFLLAAVGAAALTQNHEQYRLMTILHLLEQTASIVQVGLLASLFVISAYLSLAWRNFAFGIALGTGFDSTINLAVVAIKAQFGLTGNPYLNVVTVGTYDVCVLMWIFYLLAPERPRFKHTGQMPQHDLELWNEELQRMTRQ